MSSINNGVIIDKVLLIPARITDWVEMSKKFSIWKKCSLASFHMYKNYHCIVSLYIAISLSIQAENLKYVANVDTFYL